jgi:hypothetical protein
MNSGSIPANGPVFMFIGRRLDRLNRSSFFALCAVLSLTVSVFFFSPKFWLMRRPLPGTFEWARALTYLHQCQVPFAQDVEPAMRWRLLPPLVAHCLGMTGYSALALPVIGLLVLLGYWACVSERWFGNRLDALLFTILLGTTGAALTVTNWLGVNDSWFLLGLVVITAGQGPWSLFAATLLAPWVDERFLLGLPLAVFCRWWLHNRPEGFARVVVFGALGLLPYLLIRVCYTLWYGDATSVAYVTGTWVSLPAYVPYIRLGWWMGLRAAWILVILGIWSWWRDGGWPMFSSGLICAGSGMITITVLAADLSRSTNILLPLLFCGAVALRRYYGDRVSTNHWLAGITLGNLIMPCVLVTYDKTDLIWGFPLELLRWFKNRL